MTEPIIPDYFSVENCAERFRGVDDNSVLFARALGVIEVAATFIGVDDSARIRMIRNVSAAVDLVQRERRTGARPIDQDAKGAAAFDRGFMREHRRATARELVDTVAPAPVACSPKCNDLNIAGPTGTARSWHSDDCPVPVMHHVTDGVTACRVPVADLPRSDGYAPDRDGYITCKSCIEELRHSKACREQLEERPCRFDCPARDAARTS